MKTNSTLKCLAVRYSAKVYSINDTDYPPLFNIANHNSNLLAGCMQWCPSMLVTKSGVTLLTIYKVTYHRKVTFPIKQYGET